jgi:ankyrin repeat protein
MVEQLLAAGAHVNASLSGSGSTPLHLAVLGQHSSIVQQLVRAGAEVNVTSSQHGFPLATAISSAIGSGDTSIVDQLLRAGADPNSSSNTTPASLLLLAIKEGHIQIAEWLLRRGAAAGGGVVDDTQRTILHLAAERGYNSLVEQLIPLGVPLDAKDSSGMTPLMAAVTAEAVVRQHGCWRRLAPTATSATALATCHFTQQQRQERCSWWQIC